MIEHVILTLKVDGTFIAEYKNSEITSGTYEIKNNILTTSVCNDKVICDKYIKTIHKTSSDCSTINWGDPDYYQYNIYLKK